VINIEREVLHAALRAVLPFVCQDDTRTPLLGVCFTQTSSGLVLSATDGHSCIEARPICTVSGTPDGRRVLIATELVEALVAAIKPGKMRGPGDLMTLVIGRPVDPSETPAVLVSGPGIAQGNAMPTVPKAVFPDLERVVPKRVDATQVDDAERDGARLLGLSPMLLGRAGTAAGYFAAARKLATDNYNRSREFQITWPACPLSPVRLDLSIRDRGSLTIVLMPMRV
jgi:hypothetical protein